MTNNVEVCLSTVAEEGRGTNGTGSAVRAVRLVSWCGCKICWGDLDEVSLQFHLTVLFAPDETVLSDRCPVVVRGVTVMALGRQGRLSVANESFPLKGELSHTSLLFPSLLFSFSVLNTHDEPSCLLACFDP